MEKRKSNNTGKQKKEQEHVGVAFYLKKEMATLVDHAYADVPTEVRHQMKSFRIHLTEKASSMLGDSRFWPDSQTSDLEIYGVADQDPVAIIVILIHQVTHHIDYILRGTTAHDSEFYNIHKCLLTTALNMDMLKKDKFDKLASGDRVYSKAADILTNYERKQIEYKQDYYKIAVYNVFKQREALKSRGYWWNSLDKSWETEISSADLAKELDYLGSIDIDPENVFAFQNEGILIRHRQIIRVTNVSYESIDTLNRLGFHYQKKGNRIYWEKQFLGDLSKEELVELEDLQGIKYKIT